VHAAATIIQRAFTFSDGLTTLTTTAIDIAAAREHMVHRAMLKGFFMDIYFSPDEIYFSRAPL
jgi:hypothetical protein